MLRPIWWARATRSSSTRMDSAQGNTSLSMTFHMGVRASMPASHWVRVTQSEPPTDMKEMTLSFRMRGSGAVPPVSSAILVPMMLLPRSMRGPKRSVIVWKRPVAPFSKMGVEKTMPSASSILSSSQSKSSFSTHLPPRPPSTLCTQAVQPVQCSMCRFCSWMNSTSAPISLAPIRASMHIPSLLPLRIPPEIPKIFICTSSF